MEENIKFKAVGLPDPDLTIDPASDITKVIADDPRLGSQLTGAALSKFTTLSESREQQYKIFDEMSTDVVIASALELYADDATEYSDDGSIIWAESDKSEIAKSANQILKSLNLDQTAWQHVHALVKYGDIYLETFRKSDLNDKQKVLNNSSSKKLTKALTEKTAIINEKLILNIYDKEDNLEEHIEMYPNPADIFDLTQRGKTVGFLKTPPVRTLNADNYLYNYDLTSNDVKLYDPSKFIHIFLPDTLTRRPEVVKLQKNSNSSENWEYQVVRGKSILADLYKIYREMKLLEDSLLLNRVTRSSIVRILGVEVGDMSKADVQAILTQIKSLFEQKLAMSTDGGIRNYAGSGPIENNIYVPIRNGLGGITASNVGGDVNVGELTDLDYFNNKLFAGLKIPKPFLGFMDDNAGFSGGESLTKVSNRYAKTIKRIQNAYMQGIKTLLNIFFLDRGQYNYINNFSIKMESPSTIEDNEKIQSTVDKVALIDDISRLFTDIEDTAERLALTNQLMKQYLGNSPVTDKLDEMIDNLRSTASSLADQEEEIEDEDIESEIENNINLDIEANDIDQGDMDLPTPSDLGIDMVDNEDMENELSI